MLKPVCQPAEKNPRSKMERVTARAPLLAASAAVALGVSAGWLSAAQIEGVTVKGAEFIGGDQILAACPVEAGARLSGDDLAATEECLMATGAFRSAKAEVVGKTLVLEVEELNTRPGRLEFGIGYDSAQGAYASALYERYNLLPGVFGGLELRLGEELRSAKSYLFSKEAIGGYDVGLDMAHLEVKGEDYGFTHRRFSFEPYLATDLGEGLRAEMGLGYRKDQMSRIEPGASAFFRAEEGLREAPYLRISLKHAQPTEAEAKVKSNARIDYVLWGLGKSDRQVTLTAEGETRIALDETYSLGLRVGGGMVRGRNDTGTRTIDRFTLGGAALRGFAHRGVGPNDRGWQLGGENYLVASVGVDRKIGEVFGAPATVGLFADAGSAWGFEGAPELGKRAWRSSVGASLTLDLGGVPVSAYLAKPLSKQPGDKTQYFGLSVEFLR